MKRKYSTLTIIIFITNVIINIIVAVKLSGIFASQFTMNNFIIMSINANIPFWEVEDISRLLFAIYCLAAIGVMLFDIVMFNDGDVSGTCISMLIEIVALIIILKAPDGLSFFNSIMSLGTLIGAIPLVIGVGFFVGAETFIGKVFAVLLLIVLFIVTAVLEIFIAILIKRFLYYVFSPEDGGSKSSSRSGSFREDIGNAADMYVDMKNAENLQKAADELERIRFDMSRKK